jgi:hypothetical protein
MLTAYRLAETDAPTLQCGCWSGTEAELKKYIKDGPEHLRSTRTLAMKTVLKLLDAHNDKPC